MLIPVRPRTRVRFPPPPSSPPANRGIQSSREATRSLACGFLGLARVGECINRALEVATILSGRHATVERGVAGREVP